MAVPEMDLIRRQVCNQLRGTVHTWHMDLQTRYGDPRVYALQQQQMNRVDATLAHDLSRRNSALLKDAYAEQKTRNRNQHQKRISATRDKLKNPDRRRSATPLQSEGDPPHTQPSLDEAPRA